MECVTCVCVWLGAEGVGGEWMTGLGLGFTSSGGTWGKWDMCLGCGGMGGVGGEWVRGLGQGLGGCCYVCVCCESGFSAFMAGPGICILCQEDSCTS